MHRLLVEVCLNEHHKPPGEIWLDLDATIRVKLMQIGARVRSTVRRVWLSFSLACPYDSDIAQSLANLQRHPARLPPG